MKNKVSKFDFLNILLFTVISIICLYPIAHLIYLSILDSKDNQLTFYGYKMLLQNENFWYAMAVSLKRVILHSALSLLISFLCAYPLSKQNSDFKFRKFYIWLFMTTTVFSGGLFTTFLVIRGLGLYNTIFSLVLPQIINTTNIILLVNYLRQIPKEIEQSAKIDGANQLQILLFIILPISKPAIATILILSAVYSWNEWFFPIIYLSSSSQYPLQTYIKLILQSDFSISNIADINAVSMNSNNTIKYSQVFVSILPILISYPFLQKYFTKGAKFEG